MTTLLSGARKRELRAQAQRLDATVRLGRAGLSEAWFKAFEAELVLHGLVKVRFAELKEERKQIAPEIATRSHSELIALVGNVAVFFREKPKPAAAGEP